MIGKERQRLRSGNWSQNSGRQSSQNWGSNWGEQSGVSRGESWGSNWGDQIGESTGRNWGTNSSHGSSSSGGGTSYSSSHGSSAGGSTGTSRSWSRGGSYGVNSGTSHSVSSGGNFSNGLSVSHGSSQGGGWSEHVEYSVQPRVFAAELRKGGKADRYLVDGVMVQGGRRFARTGAHWLPCTFKQQVDKRFGLRRSIALLSATIIAYAYVENGSQPGQNTVIGATMLLICATLILFSRSRRHRSTQRPLIAKPSSSSPWGRREIDVSGCFARLDPTWQRWLQTEPELEPTIAEKGIDHA
jgi:hypothetical protein